MNILVTGAFGFVGTNLSKGLKSTSGVRLIAIDMFQPENHEYDEVFSWKELNKIDWEKIDAIIHLAGKAHDTKNTTEEKDYFDINVGLTEKIFDCFLQSNASKFVFFSSVKAAADKVHDKLLFETVFPNPGTSYGKSKLAAEKSILNKTLPVKKMLYILRPCMIHGPGNKGNLNLLYRLAQKGIPWPLGSFKNKRSFTSMDNLLFVLIKIINSDITPGIYQIADDEPISTNRLIQLIAESRGKKARILNLNIKFIQGVARLGDFLQLPLNSERLQKLTESYVVSNKKMKRELKIENLPVSAEEGMIKTLKSF